MSKTLELVKEAYKAWESKDAEALKKVLHADYVAKMPGGMEIKGIDGAIHCLSQCPFESHGENEIYVTEGDSVVRMWDMVAEGEKGFRVRMAELTVVKDGKILANEAFFDSKAFPKEAQEQFEEEKKKMAHAAEGK